MDNYRVLGLRPKATDKEVKKQWKVLARKYHPDKNPHQDAGEIFKEMSKAYQAVTQERKKKVEERARIKAELLRREQEAKAKIEAMAETAKLAAAFRQAEADVASRIGKK